MFFPQPFFSPMSYQVALLVLLLLVLFLFLLLLLSLAYSRRCTHVVLLHCFFRVVVLVLVVAIVVGGVPSSSSSLSSSVVVIRHPGLHITVYCCFVLFSHWFVLLLLVLFLSMWYHLIFVTINLSSTTPRSNIFWPN